MIIIIVVIILIIYIYIAVDVVAFIVVFLIFLKVFDALLLATIDIINYMRALGESREKSGR